MSTGATRRRLQSLVAGIVALALAVVTLEVLHPLSVTQMTDVEERQETDKQVEPEPVKIKIRKIEKPKPPVRQVRKAESKAEPASAVPVPQRPPVLRHHPFVPAPTDFVRGKELLAGEFPRMRGYYSRVGWEDYRDAMISLGSRFYVWDAHENQPLASLDPITGETSEAKSQLGLSPFPRDVSSNLTHALAEGKKAFGDAASHVVMLPPERFDAALLSGLEKLLRRNGIQSDRVSSFEGAFEIRNGGLWCEVLSTSLKDGTTREVAFLINLASLR